MNKKSTEKYSEMTDNELIELCRNGDEKAVTAIISRYSPMVRSRVSAYFSMFDESYYDDFIQEGNIALFAAVNTYDFKSSSFRTYSRVCVDRALIGILRRENTKKKIPESLVVGLYDEDISENTSPEQILLEQEGVNDLYAKLQSSLSDFEYKIFKAYLTGVSHEEIAKSLCVTTKSVNNALSRIRRKLKNSV